MTHESLPVNTHGKSQNHLVLYDRKELGPSLPDSIKDGVSVVTAASLY